MALKKRPIKKKVLKKAVKKKRSVKKPVKKKLVKKKLSVKKVINLKKKKTKKKIKKSSKNLVKKVSLKNPKSKKISKITLKKSKILNTLLNKVARKKLKKPPIVLPKLPEIEVSNYPKNKVKTILVSQPQPSETEKNPYFDLAKKYNLNINFRQFIKVEGLTIQEFRTQRIDILQHGAVILTSKMAVDHYFRICNELRITVPESIKYFCINEQTAYYLQKYIVFRKRKIFFGHGTIVDLVDVIQKNKDEKFLLPSSDFNKEQIVGFLEEVKITFTKAIFYKTVSAELSDIQSLKENDILVFFTPAGIKSLKYNFPNFKQDNIRIAAFGHATANMVKSLKLRLDIFAPNIKDSSMTGAIDTYIKLSLKNK